MNSTAKKGLIATALLLTSAYAFGKVKQISNLESEVLIDFDSFDLKNIKFKGTSLVLPFKMAIKNFSNFTISPSNVWAVIEKKDTSNGTYTPILTTNQIPVLNLTKGNTVLANFSIEIGLLNALKLLDKYGEYRITTKYLFKGIPQSSNSELKAATIVAALSKYFPNKALNGTSTQFQFA